MIKQISSHDLNQIMLNAQQQLGSAQKELGIMKSMVANRLDILDDENLWTQKCLTEAPFVPDTSYLSVPTYTKTDGEYSRYYCDIAPDFVKEPLNVFNITSTQTVFFRDDVKLSIIHPNGEKEDATDILKHDSLKPTYFHKRFDQKEVIMLLEIQDYQRPLGASRFNMIEIDAFMPGSYTLKSLSLIYGDETITYTDFNKLAKNRILLDEKKQINKIEFAFDILNEVKVDQEAYYPLAFKHIYLLDADFKENSYVIVKVESDNYINLIQDECMVSSNRGVLSTTLKTLGAEVYAHYADNQLYMPIPISNAYEVYEIPLLTKSLYVKIPIKESLSYIGFKIKDKP